MAAVQRRRGPDVVGFQGFLQPLADGLKLLFKELIFPYKSTKFLFFFCPLFLFSISLIIQLTFPGQNNYFFTSLDSSVLFIFALSSLNVYGLLLSGQASNSQYSYIGGIRATAQMLSYELLFSMVNLLIFFFANSLSLADIIYQQNFIQFIFPCFPLFLFFLILMLAETNRTPFDLAEAEAESVAGYNVEYSGIVFALFFLGEYANMLFLSVYGSSIFFGGFFFAGIDSLLQFLIKILSFATFFIFIRATLPRYRQDQLMEICQRELFLLMFGFFFFFVGLYFFFNLVIDNEIFFENMIFFL